MLGYRKQNNNTQYLRRLLRHGKLDGVKIGQLWLIDKNALDFYIERSKYFDDQRFGPKSLSENGL